MSGETDLSRELPLGKHIYELVIPHERDDKEIRFYGDWVENWEKFCEGLLEEACELSVNEIKKRGLPEDPLSLINLYPIDFYYSIVNVLKKRGYEVLVVEEEDSYKVEYLDYNFNEYYRDSDAHEYVKSAIEYNEECRRVAELREFRHDARHYKVCFIWNKEKA
jgi:hypothetical protein